jgi:iron complex outermembrane recepter protein
MLLTMFRLAPLVACLSLTVQAESSYLAEEVIVTSTRSAIDIKDLPQVVTVISKEQIEEQLRLTSDTSQILSNILPAFSPNRQKLTSSGETFRGRAPLLMIDGIPQSNPLRPAGRSGQTIDLSMVDRIEVIHGASAIHGLGATGGVINFITRRPQDGSFKQYLSVQSTMPTDGVIVTR